MYPDRIIKYVVRVPGCTSWSEHKAERAAHAECKKANRIVQPGHVVFAKHQSGAVTGPYEEVSVVSSKSKRPVTKKSLDRQVKRIAAELFKLQGYKIHFAEMERQRDNVHDVLLAICRKAHLKGGWHKEGKPIDPHQDCHVHPALIRAGVMLLTSMGTKVGGPNG